jgi:hypothetical protein
MLRRRQFLVASLFLATCAVGCSDSKEKELAERVLDHHFDALKRRAFESALADYDNEFFTDVTRTEWRVALSSVVDKLGAFRSYEINSSGLAYKKVAGPGSYLRFQVAVTYAKYPSEEVFYLFRKKDSTKYKIVGHQIDADGLNK